MGSLLLTVLVIIQVGLGSYVLFKNHRAWVNRLFAGCMLAYSSSTIVSLLRLAVVSEHVASVLALIAVIIALIWNTTFIAWVIAAMFYPEQLRKHPLWFLLLPLGVALLGTILVAGTQVNLDEAASTSPVLAPGTYSPMVTAFPSGWLAVGYAALCTVVALALLLNVIIRRPKTEARSALLLGAIVLLSGGLGFFGSRFLHGSLRVSVPSVSNALLSLAFGYVVLRYRLFAPDRVAFELITSNLREGMLVFQSDQTVLNCNQSAATLLGLPRQAILRHSLDDVLTHSPLPRDVWTSLWSELQQGLPATSETQYLLDESLHFVVNEATPIRDPTGQVHGYVWMMRDITELRSNQKEIEARDAELQSTLSQLRATTESQSALLTTIQALSAPAVPVIQGIIVLPLSGQIDSDRARRIIENLLAGIEEHNARIAILDITGVPVVDTVVAQYLIRAARAASLMGCRPLLVGIRPEIAMVLVELGIDMEGMMTFSDLQSGVEHALRALGMKFGKGNAKSIHATVR